MAKQGLYWKKLSGLGTQFIVLIPKDMKVKVTDILWNKDIMDKISIATHNIPTKKPHIKTININM